MNQAKTKRDWRIRPATAADADGLKRCMESAYAVYQSRIGGARLPPMDADYRAEIDEYPTWVVVSGNAVLGGLIMVFERDRASIANIAVDPQAQGQGIGGALIKWAESAAREKGFSELHLTTHALLEENLSLYRHLGWAETHRHGSKVHMRKAI